MVIKIILCVLVVVVIAFIVNAIENRSKINNSKISFRESMDLTDLPVITFYIGDKKLNFMLDTGSNISCINEKIVNTIEYTPLEEESSFISHDGLSQVVSLCEIKFQYKEYEFNEEFSIIDLEEAFNHIKQESGVTIHGLLGNEFFRKYKYVLDFKELIAYLKN